MNIFDPDRTHDSLFAQKIKGQILTLLKNAISTRGIFDDPFPFCLIERTAPGALKPWAEDWSGKMFEFLKPLSRTFILDDGYLNGSAYGFEPEYTADLPELIDLEGYHLDRLTVRIAPKTEGILTWLERTHDEQSAPYCAKVTNQIAIAMRRSKVFRNPTNETQEFELSTRNWLHNSVCFQSLELVGVTANQAKFLLYDNMHNFLDFLMGELRISSCKVLTGFTAKNTKTFNVLQKNRDFPFSVQGSGYQDDQLVNQTLEFINPVFSTVPSFFHNAYMFTGTETGSITTVYNQSSQSFSLYVNHNYSYLEFFDSFFSPPIRGYELNQTPYTNKNFPEIKVSVPGDPTDLQANFATIKNNHDLENYLIGDRNWVAFPPFTMSQAQQASAFLDKGETANLFNIGFYCDSTNLAHRVQSFGSLTLIESQGNNTLYYNSGGFAFGREGAYQLQKSWNNESNQGANRLQFKKDFFSLSFFSDPVLFSGFDSYLCNSDLAIRCDFGLNWDPESGFDGGAWVWDYVTRSEIAQKTAIKISVDFGENLMQLPNISWAATENSATTIFSSTDGEDTSLTYSAANQDTVSVDIVLSVQLTRSLRQSFPNFPSLIVENSAATIPHERLTIYYGAPGEAELNAILYPNGEDGDPFLGPDTDGGDIMPDSIRIKEIHAALEADKYGVHPDSTEENPKKRLNNLGRLMEGAAYVLGINFNADGENVPYPEPVLFDPEKIEEINDKKILKNAQFAVAEINGAFDTSSLYEVRSPILKGDRKGATIDQRPHAVKYHNLPQLLDVISDDTAKQLGGGKNSIFQVPNANGDDYQQYEGMYQALADALYMLSVHSKSINELQNQSIKTVWMLSQILKALGVPCHVEKVDGVSGLYDENGNELPGYLAVPGIDAKSPTLVGLLGIVLLNLQRVVGSSIGFRTDEAKPEDNANNTKVSISASPFVINAKDGGNFKFVVKRTTEKEEAKDEKIFINLVINSTLGKDAFEGGFTPGLWSIPLEPGEMSKGFSIEVGQNDDYLENHSITVILSGGEGYSLGANKSATVAILSGQNKEEEKEPEIPDTDWLLEFIAPDKKPDFTPDLEE